MVLGTGEGRIEIFLERTAFSYSDTIKGRLTLFLDKPKDARGLRICLTAITGRGKHSHTLYNNCLNLDSAKLYSAGRKDYEFQLRIPLKQELMQSWPKMPAFLANLSEFWTLSSTNWYLDASLDIQGGLDVNKKLLIAVK